MDYWRASCVCAMELTFYPLGNGESLRDWQRLLTFLCQGPLWQSDAI